jgi:putative nucleotidyltransferase with HDIG domain
MQRNQQAMEGKPPDVGLTYELANRMNLNKPQQDALLLLTRIRKKDEYTLYHSISVSSLVLNMCSYGQIIEHRALDLAVGALFHDIGKTLVPQDILNKPGKLTAEEYRAIQLHVEYSVNLLSEAKGLPLECLILPCIIMKDLMKVTLMLKTVDRFGSTDMHLDVFDAITSGDAINPVWNCIGTAKI